jgi:hypothetical protein
MSATSFEEINQLVSQPPTHFAFAWMGGCQIRDQITPYQANSSLAQLVVSE